jgi:glycogen operon protein
MGDADWQQDYVKSFAVFLNGDGLRDVDEDGHAIRDDSFLLLFNAHHDCVPFRMPAALHGAVWRKVLDTSSDAVDATGTVDPGETLDISARTVVVLSRPPARVNIELDRSPVSEVGVTPSVNPS